MTRAQAWTLHVANALVGGTGLVYAWMRYVAEADDPFAVVNHPWQPAVQHAHVLVAPLLVFAVGMVWTGHAWHHYRSRTAHRRRTGLSLGLLFLPMAASGYALQVCADERWRLAWVWCHGLASALWVVATAAHLLGRRRAQTSTISTSWPDSSRSKRSRSSSENSSQPRQRSRSSCSASQASS